MSERLSLRVGYIVLGFGAWVTLRVFGLRRRVVRENLRRSFPDWSPAELRAVEREFVRRQGEAAAEVLYSSRIGADELRERVTLANPAVLASPAKNNLQFGDFAVTGIHAQFGQNDHFAIFDNATAAKLYQGFLLGSVSVGEAVADTRP
jgi:hypothetical protein